MKPAVRIILSPNEDEAVNKELEDIEHKIDAAILIGASNIVHKPNCPADALYWELGALGYQCHSYQVDQSRIVDLTENRISIRVPVKKC